MAKAESIPRFVEIDLLRSIAIVMMVVYHLFYDLWYFYDFSINPTTGEWVLFARSTASLFLVIVGISFVIASEKKRTEKEIWSRSLKRGATVFGFGMLITLVTFYALPSNYVRFGILHCIGISMMLLPLFRKFQGWNIVLGLLVIMIGRSIDFRVDTALLLPFGIMPRVFSTIDYYPLLPWFGVILIGMGIGSIFYTKRTPVTHAPIWNTLALPGRHALLIYLVHQPILLGIFRILLGPFS